MKRLQRYASVSSIALTARGRSGRLRAGTARPAIRTTAANGAATNIGVIDKPAPSSATANRAAAMMPRRRVVSILVAAYDRHAGSNVKLASMVTATAMLAPIPRPEMNFNPINSIPSSEMTTVAPANNTARPAVSIAAMIASSSEYPSVRFSRNRVRMNSE